MIKVTNTIWFTSPIISGPATTIGLVFTIDELTSTRKVYIGFGNGIDEELDIERIRNQGAKFPEEIAGAILDFYLEDDSGNKP